MKKWSMFILLLVSVVLARCNIDSSSSVNEELDIKSLVEEFSTRELSAE
ncbi:hypothetical protein [Jeotgalibacillus salarius]|nr:hypothetical protein [Jeotgalibacillus salarius]